VIAAHQQITDETGQTFILLPLEEYNALLGGNDELLERLADESESGLIQERLLEPKISMAEMMAELRADGVL
jgi:hypothetical protein